MDELTPEAALLKIGEITGLSQEDFTPENCVIDTAKAVDTRNRCMAIIERRKRELAEALEVDESVPWPRLIQMVKSK